MVDSPATRLDSRLHKRLTKRAEQGLIRRRRPLDADGVSVSSDGRELINFCSNDYLGLKQHPRIVAAMADGARRYGVGSGSSALISGYGSPHVHLEQKLAEWLGYPAAIVFSSGFLANLALITTLAGKDSVIVSDQLNHASLIDGARLSKAKVLRYRHADVDSMAQQLKVAGPGALVITDGVFSMDGDFAPLPKLSSLCADAGATLIVDDAHGLGAVGERGRGSLDHFQLGHDELPVLVGTFGKALGTAGAFVAGSEQLIHSLVQWGRSGIYTTAISPALVAATIEAIAVIEDEGANRRASLNQSIQQFRSLADQAGLGLLPSSTAIQPYVVGGAEKVMAISAALEADGLLVTGIRPPTVPPGTARLRMTLTSDHRLKQIERLVDALARASR